MKREKGGRREDTRGKKREGKGEGGGKMKGEEIERSKGK